MPDIPTVSENVRHFLADCRTKCPTSPAGRKKTLNCRRKCRNEKGKYRCLRPLRAKFNPEFLTAKQRNNHAISAVRGTCGILAQKVQSKLSPLMSQSVKISRPRIDIFGNPRTYNVRENVLPYRNLFIRRVGRQRFQHYMSLIGIFEGIFMKTIDYHIQKRLNVT